MSVDALIAIGANILVILGFLLRTEHRMTKTETKLQVHLDSYDAEVERTIPRARARP